MAGILLVTHNGLGDSFVDCVKHVLGEVPAHIRYLSVLASDDPHRKEAEGSALIAQLDNLRAVYGYRKFNLIGHSQGGEDRAADGERQSGAAGHRAPVQAWSGTAGAGGDVEDEAPAVPLQVLQQGTRGPSVGADRGDHSRARLQSGATVRDPGVELRTRGERVFGKDAVGVHAPIIARAHGRA